MAGITSSIGLITGVPIQDTVDKLLKIAAKPHDDLVTRTSSLKDQQTAVNQLSTRALGFQFAFDKLKNATLFSSRTATSSDQTTLKASIPAGATPTTGTTLVRPVRAASAQQIVSQRFETLDSTLASGDLTFRLGGFVDKGISLDQLNDGAGVQRGKIKITDRSGTTATIDLSYARTVDDVVSAINSNGSIAVTASAVGDSFKLVDASGGSGNLSVAEVGGGKTAAGLGLAGISVAANEATGADVYRIFNSAKLIKLNDGNGVDISKAGIADLVVSTADGSTVSVDLAGASTVSDVLTKINAAGAGKVTAAIAPDGNRLKLTDLTTGSATFAVTDGVASTAATDLGLAKTGTGGVINGARLISGLQDTLLSQVNGGAGVGTLGSITVTDRNGGSGTISLAAAETVGDVVRLINASSADVEASVNSARNGIAVADASGGSGNLVVANADATNAADKLGLAVNAAVDSVNSGTLNKQTLGRATLLTSLNGNLGVKLGSLRVTDTAGRSQTATLNATDNEATTVGDVIDAINALSVGVEARINDRGDGILIVDTAGGAGTLGIKDSAGDVGKSLNLTRASKTQTIANVARQTIDGTATQSVDLSNLQTDADAIVLSTLNGGAGIHFGDVKIFNSQGGDPIAFDFNGADAGVTTVGDVIDLINARAAERTGFNVTARLNDAGTGILLEDSAGGRETLKVVDVNSTTAAELKLTATATTSGTKQQINGAGLFASVNGAQTGLAGIAAKINDLNAGVTASTVFDGVGYRLSLAVDAGGDANQLLVDGLGGDLVFTEISKGQDALLQYGDGGIVGAGVLLSSPNGQFSNSVGGLDLTVLGGSETAVSVSVASSDSDLVKAAQDMVDAYNSLRSDLDKLTAFDSEKLTTGLLFGSREALTLDQSLSRILTDRYFGLGDFQSLEQVGIGLDADGKLSLNKSRLQTAFARDPEGVKTFFTDADKGVVKKVGAAVDRLVDAKTGSFGARFDALQDTIDANTKRIEQYQTQLDAQRERLLNQFAQLESIIAQLQTNQQALSNIQVISPLSSSK